ncbi:ATP-dependent DNA ligase [Diaminobutyricibacter sp. McL0618]|uniref:DUF7882 family protein n=1 Tax=Leifsonia sp. McL0618 TaxID=3415677 RepID=UPI003CF57E02
MGTLTYGTGREITLDDRTLSHLQIAIGLKLRRQEGFFFSWNETDTDTERHCAIWIDPGIPLVFRYDGIPSTPVNRNWLEQLTQSSNSARGLQLLPEEAAIA